MLRRMILTTIALCGCVLPVSAQDETVNIRPGLGKNAGQQTTTTPPPTTNPATGTTVEGGKPFPTGAAIVAAVSTIVILMIICTPSRRA
jgi:hypothetical protein